MISCKKSSNTTVKTKAAVVTQGHLVDQDTGEDILSILSSIYGAEPFELSTSYKSDEAVNEGGEETE